MNLGSSMQKTSRRAQTISWTIALGGILLLGLAAACARPHETADERIRRQAAEDARQIRHDAQNAGVEARQAARQAGREARDIVAGVKEGWQDAAPPRPRESGSKLDLNTASSAQLSALPGISPALARKIVRRRPYSDPHELVTRSLISQAQFDRVSSRIRAHEGTGN
jgi:DNA uptake protein ComE-like DNA-binding protein